MLLLLIASSKVIVIIIGTSFGGKSPGMVVPSSEQKQSGSTQTAGSHGGARFGSLSMSERIKFPFSNYIYVIGLSVRNKNKSLDKQIFLLDSIKYRQYKVSDFVL